MLQLVYVLFAVTTSCGIEAGKSASDGESWRSEVSVSSRARQIADDIDAINREASCYGGWAAWDNQLRPFRRQFARYLEELRDGGQGVIRGKNGFLVHRDRAAYMIEIDLHRRPGGAERAFLPSPSVTAITELDSQLRQLSIDLIVVPVPFRGDVYIDYLPVHNPPVPPMPQQTQLILELLESGVEVIDLAALFRELRRGDSPLLYHLADPHWTCAAMVAAARVLAGRLDRYPAVEESLRAPRQYHYEAGKVAGRAGLADYLPPEDRKVYERVRWGAQRITEADGSAYTAPASSPILIIGDSYAGHLSAASAGIDAQLAYEINAPVSLLWHSGGGAGIPGILNRSESAQLDERRVVIWVFDARNFTGRRDVYWRVPDLSDDEATPANE